MLVKPMSFVSCRKNNAYIARSNKGCQFFSLMKMLRQKIPTLKSDNDQEYDILTLNKEVVEEILYDVELQEDQNERFHETTEKYIFENGACDPIKQEATLERSGEITNKFESRILEQTSAKLTIRAGFSLLKMGGDKSSTNGRTKTSVTSTSEQTTKSVKMELNVPPQKSCHLLITSTFKSVTIPYNAKLKRIYKNNMAHETSISGTYFMQKMDNVKVVENCIPLNTTNPCTNET